VTGDWSSDPAGPPMSAPEPRLHHFSAAGSYDSSDDSGIEGGVPDDYEKRKT